MLSLGKIGTCAAVCKKNYLLRNDGVVAQEKGVPETKTAKTLKIKVGHVV